jgi:hypothetical protein
MITTAVDTAKTRISAMTGITAATTKAVTALQPTTNPLSLVLINKHLTHTAIIHKEPQQKDSLISPILA